MIGSTTATTTPSTGSWTADQLANTRKFFETPGLTGDQIYTKASNLGLSSNQLADLYAQSGMGDYNTALNSIDQYLSNTGQQLGSGEAWASYYTPADTTPAVTTPAAAAPTFVDVTTPYGSYTADELASVRKFFDQPGLTGDQIYAAANELGLSADQLADLYAQTGKGYFDSALKSINEYLTERGRTLTGGGRPVTQPGILGTEPTPSVYDEVAGYLRSGAERTQELMGYEPQQITATQAATPTTFPQINMSQYMNPYTQEVIDRSLADIERQRVMAENQLGAQATAAGAFGGSRYGVAQGILGGEYGRLAANTAAALRQAGYTEAANLAQQDIARQTQVDLANIQAQNLAAAQNQAAGLQGAQIGLSGAQQLANIGNLGFGMANTVQQNMLIQGALQQAQMQSLIDAAKLQYGGYTGTGTSGLGLIGGAAGGMPIGQTQTTSGGGLDPLSALLMIGMAPVTGGGSLFGSMLGGGAAAGAAGAGALGGGYSIASNPYLLGSDMRLKTDIQKIGTLPNGLNTYTWKWNEKAKEIGVENQPTIGVMAQEAIKVMPHAVIEGDDGYLRVNYAEILK